MIITEIIVHEGRGYNHPCESYSNFKQGVTLKATIYEDEDASVCIKRLQEKASVEIEAIKNETCYALRKINSLEEAERQIERVPPHVSVRAESFRKENLCK